MSASRARGTRWETAVATYLRERGWPHAERRALNGNQDRGDIAGVIDVVIECKSAARHEPGPWLDEAHKEQANGRAAVGVVWFKRRGKTNPGAGFVLMDGHTFTHLLKEAGY